MKSETKNLILFFVSAAFFTILIIIVVPKAVPKGETYSKEVEQIASGVVVSAPRELNAGIWIMEVELSRDAKDPILLQAITSQPEQFCVGDKTELHSVITSHKSRYRDMFYIAVKPKAKGGQ